jgi:SAM-dependent methyltransferase
MSEEDAIGTKPQTGSWRVITEHYEKCLRQHGATPAGVDWPSGADLAARFGVMLELLAEAGERPELLDVGCGSGLMLDYLAATGALHRVAYRGIDLSEDMIRMAQSRWPENAFSCRDIVAEPLADQSADVVIMNGVLTERISLGVETMTKMAQSLVAAAYRIARVGIAFNVMNAHVDWQRNDLFHWPFDDLASFLKREVSRHYVLRADYGLYEYTCVVRRHPKRPTSPSAENWWVR